MIYIYIVYIVEIIVYDLRNWQFRGKSLIEVSFLLLQNVTIFCFDISWYLCHMLLQGVEVVGEGKKGEGVWT
jgi:hypothetical protein